MHTCSRCGETKTDDLFPRDAHKASGFRSWCKACANTARGNWYDQTRRPAATRTCVACGEDKQASEFRAIGVLRGGNRRICNACVARAPEGHKVCSKCGQAKPLSEYYPHTGQPDGKQPGCKACDYQIKLASQAKRPEHYRAKNQTIRRRSHARRNYNLSREDYEALVAAANGRCTACGRPERIKHRDGTVWDLCIDHDHTTGQVRALICHDCNRALGYAGDSAERLRQLAAYLERFSP